MNDTETYTFDTFTGGGVDYKAELFRKYTLQINNNVTVSAATTEGIPLQYDIKPVYSIIIDLDYNLVTEKMLKDFTENTANYDIKFKNGVTANLDGELSIDAPFGISENTGFTYNGEYHAISKTVGIYSNSAATPLTIDFTDTTDWTY